MLLYFNDKINVVIIVFDYSNKESIIDIHNWLLKCNNQYIFLIGTNFTDNEKLEINLGNKIKPKTTKTVKKIK